MSLILPKNLPLTTARLQLATEFLARHNFHLADIKLEAIAKDVGERLYLRVTRSGQSYVLMDCPPSYQNIEPFLKIANILKQHGFNSPDILYSCKQHGFILMEDFGRQTIADYINANPSIDEQALYFRLIELLVDIQQQTTLDECANLPAFDEDIMLKGLEQFTKWYLPTKISPAALAGSQDEFHALWRQLLQQQVPMPQVMVHRDYHAQNIMLLSNDITISPPYYKLGLLDFQDASFGSPIYDLVSILQDARRIVAFPIAEKTIIHFAKLKNIPIADVNNNYHILGAMRNLRVIGLFTKLATCKGETKYLKYLPTLYNYLSYSCSHDILRPLQEWLYKYNIIK